MLRAVILLCAALAINGGGAFAEENAPAKVFRYAILIDQHEPIYGEVACSKYPCQMVDHKASDITLSLVRYDDSSVRPIVYCRTRNCYIPYRSENINLRKSGRLLKFSLAKGPGPRDRAVFLQNRQVGDIIVAF
ncbi:hypothetical protein HNQ72_000239 [Rhizobium wenxiniae]|uniref:Uncharacterized protein n=1 Tax=Rhizobium wenxiniae TaxID=1737357 RepID=A0A7W9Y1T3_9HYPH|nr:hypothetical protein [Rhizobium wenxiniae]